MGRVPAPQGSDSALTVFLVTIGPGAQVWERFGHNALWVHDPAAGTDLAYDYGRFDFRQENFFLRFAQGRMAYSMDSASVDRIFSFYGARERFIQVQELALAPAAAAALQAALRAHVHLVRTEGWTYPYHYYWDNCSTRLRDAIDLVVGGAIGAQTRHTSTTHTYRDHALRSTANNPPLALVLDLIQGPSIDRPISAWEEMFLPGKLMEHLRGVTITSPDGSRAPIVRREWTQAEANRYPVPEEPPTWWPYLLALGVLLGGGLTLLARANARRMFVGLASLWTLGTGVTGAAVLWLWTASTHVVSYGNENVLQANVLSLALLWMLPAAVFGPASRKTPALGLAVFIAVASGAGVVLKLLPAFQQANINILSLAVPVHAGLVAGLYLLRTRRPA